MWSMTRVSAGILMGVTRRPRPSMFQWERGSGSSESMAPSGSFESGSSTQLSTKS
jgi:hypothetical protein